MDAVPGKTLPQNCFLWKTSLRRWWTRTRSPLKKWTWELNFNAFAFIRVFPILLFSVLFNSIKFSFELSIRDFRTPNSAIVVFDKQSLWWWRKRVRQQIFSKNLAAASKIPCPSRKPNGAMCLNWKRLFKQFSTYLASRAFMKEIKMFNTYALLGYCGFAIHANKGKSGNFLPSKLLRQQLLASRKTAFP